MTDGDTARSASQMRSRSVARVRDVAVHLRHRDFQRLGEADDAGHVERAAAEAAFVAAAVDDGRDLAILAHVERAGAFRAVHLVRGQRGHVDVERLRVERELADRLRGVGVERHAARAAERADRGDVLHGADFVVAVHDADEDGVGGEGGGEFVEVDEALAVDREAGDPVAILCQASTRIEDGLVLRRRRDDVSALVQPGRSP